MIGNSSVAAQPHFTSVAIAAPHRQSVGSWVRKRQDPAPSAIVVDDIEEFDELWLGYIPCFACTGDWAKNYL